MTRTECESRIADLLKEIRKVYFEYMEECGVEDDYLTLTVYDDVIRFNNAYWEHDDGKIDKNVWMEDV